MIEGVDLDLLVKKSYPHPVLGLMSLTQWVSYHEKRLFVQIEEIKGML
ncbi:hypothetical protein [Peribacillus alkalitolerans]|nr:hypothetical protein [Peribacillus alkalitolerans]